MAVFVTKKIEDAIRIGKKKVISFQNAGLDIEQTAEGIIIRQEHYIDEVKEIMFLTKETGTQMILSVQKNLENLRK